MKNIDIDLIKKYVNGEELGEYTIEQLEDDKDFMLGVISYTKDVKIYELCSDNVKIDYDFVRNLILKFKDNVEFITKVADNFLENNDADLDIYEKELNIIMTKLLPNELSNKYNLFSEAAYYAKRIDIEFVKANDPKVEAMIGMGFLVMFDEYNSSDIILNYYADCLLNEIIRDNNINFEKMLHSQFKSPKKIDEVGVNTYIINFIGYYDSMLSSYVSTHLDLIGKIANEIKMIQMNWEKNNMADEKKRYFNMINMVHEYLSISKSNMSEYEILYYVANELGISEKLASYDNSSFQIEDFVIDGLDDLDFELVKDEIDSSSKEKIVYQNVRKIMINQLFSEEPDDLFSLIDDKKKIELKGEGKSKCKIIELKPKDKKD